MALVVKDRVKENTTTTGTANLTLGGAVYGFQSFSVIGNGNTTYYAIYDSATGDWEVGLGTYSTTGPTLSRDTVLESSNAGSKVSFGAGSKDVFCTYPAERSVYLDGAGSAVTLLDVGTLGAGTANITAANITAGTVSTTPATNYDLVNKQYVDTLVSSGITYHTPVKYEVPDTTGNLNATYNNGAAGVGATLTNAGTLTAFTPDGVTASVGDRVLVYNQTSAAQNGVYTVTTVGSGSVAWVLTRATDADTYALKSPNGLGEGDAFFVTSGNTGAGETYVCNTVGTITFGTTAITFAQVSSAQVYSAGVGLTLSGTQFSITPTGTAGTYGSASQVPVLTTNASGQVTSVTNTAIAISAGAVSGLAPSATTDTTNASNITSGTLPSARLAGSYTGITGVGTLTAGTWNADTIAAAYGGTGQSSYTVGDLLYASGTSALSKLADVAYGNVLLSGGVGTAPSYGKVNLTDHITGTLAVVNGGTGATTASGARSNLGLVIGTDIPSPTGTGASGTWNINVTGSAGSAGTATTAAYATYAGYVANTVTFNNSGAGAASGNGFNGSGALTVSYNTIGAPSTTGSGASGTWGIDISGNAATATNGLTTSNYSSYALPLSGGTMTGPITGGGGVSTLLTGNYAGVTRGQVYNDTGGFGLLNYAGNWAVRVDYGSNSVYMPGTAYSGTDMRAPIFYDYNNTSYYVDPASFSYLNRLGLAGGLSNENYVTRVVSPGGGDFKSNTGSAAGAIKIRLPQTWINTMIRFTVKVYTYDGLSFDITCGGYNYSAGYWVNTFAYMGTADRPAQTVRFAHDGTYCCVFIGELAGSWSYPQIAVTDVQLGYSSYSAANWDSGWSVSLETSSFGAVTATQTAYPPTSSVNNTNPAYSSIYYDANNTGYYVDPSSGSYLYSLSLSGSVYFQPNSWIQLNSSYGLYWPNNNGAHFEANTLSTYTQLAMRGSKNSYGGIHDSYSGVNGIMYDSAGNGGVYREANGRWYFYYNVSTNCMGIGTSSTNGAYNIYCPTGVYSGGRVDGTIFYDASDTNYFCDPNSTSVLWATQSAYYRRLGAGYGYLDGGYGTYETTATSGPIYTIGGGYVPAANSLGNMYGVGYTYGNLSGIGITGQWGFYVASGGTARHFFDSDNGRGFSTGSYYAPIYYDLDNTGYYCDPASTSSLNAVYTNVLYSYGNVTAYASSDRKFKENIRPISNALDIVLAVGGKLFDWTDEYLADHGGENAYLLPKQSFGIVAQDLLPHLPQAIRTRQDGSLAVDYEKLSAVAFEAVRILEARVAQLEARQ